jgi:tetratricopeptide (TPR) repeat protein
VARFSLLLALTLVPVAFAAAPPASPTQWEIKMWVEQLGDDSFEVREEASTKLRAAGEFAEAALEKAADSKDAEVRKRARAILVDFRLGIYPGTPAAVVELVRKYTTLTGSEKRPIIEALLKAGAPGIRCLVKLARSEKEALVRKDIFADIARGLSRSAPLLVEKGDLLSLEALLELGVQGDLKTGAGHYAAFYLLTGQIDRKIAELEASARADPPGKPQNEVLTFLYRAKGDRSKAWRAALKAERGDLVEAILFEAGEWKRLAKDESLMPEGDWAMQKGFRAAYARLANDKKQFDKLIEDILGRARPIARDGGDVLPYAKALFFNGRANDAIALLTTAKAERQLLFNVLAAQMRYKEAFALVREARESKHHEAATLEMLQAKALAFLGEKEEALTLVKKAAKNLRGDTSVSWQTDLVEAELLLGRREEAFGHAATILALSNDDRWPLRLFGKLFPGSDREARSAWVVISEMSAKSKAEQLGLLRKMVEGKATAEELRAVIKETDGSTKATPSIWAALGEMAVWCKQEKLATDCFAKGGVPGMVRIGDLLMQKKQYASAAEQYEKAYRAALKLEVGWKAEGDEAIPALSMCLWGKALVAAGKTAAGKAKMSQAHLLPLGDEEMRHGLLKGLRKRGDREGTLREAELMSRLGDPVVTGYGNYYTAEGFRLISLRKEKAHKELEASNGFEVVFLGCMTPLVNFTRSQAYVTVPSYMRKVRAIGLARDGRFKEALAEAKTALEVWPGNLDLAVGLVPVLEKGGRKKDADQIYRDVLAAQEALLKDYPKSPLALNQLAWTAACCKRDLDKGLTWARRAVALSPKTAAYHDTLAEVLFQSGKKAEAVLSIKKALSIMPNRVYFKNQLKRMEKGDPKAPLPTDEQED